MTFSGAHTLGAVPRPTAATALPFNIAHAVGNVVFCLAFGPALVRALRRFRARFDGDLAAAPAAARRARSRSSSPWPRRALTPAPPARAAAAEPRDRLPARAPRTATAASAPRPGQPLHAGSTRALGGAWAWPRRRDPRGVRAAARSPCDLRARHAGALQRRRRPRAHDPRAAAPRPPARDARRPRPRRRAARAGAPDGSLGGLVNRTAFGILALRAAGRGPRDRAVRARGALARRASRTATAASASPARGGAERRSTTPRGALQALVGRRARARTGASRRGAALPAPPPEPRRRLPAQRRAAPPTPSRPRWAIQALRRRRARPGPRRAAGGARSPLAYLRSLVAANGARALLAHEQPDAGLGHRRRRSPALARRPFPAAAARGPRGAPGRTAWPGRAPFAALTRFPAPHEARSPKETARASAASRSCPRSSSKLTAQGPRGRSSSPARAPRRCIPDALFDGGRRDASAIRGRPTSSSRSRRRAPRRSARLRATAASSSASWRRSRDPDGHRAPGATRASPRFAMEAIPRISRAQSMDALSSQSNVGGYKAALLGAEHSTRFYPMLMTAAGTIPPAKVLVLGAGVAGLQALATARRLGAQTTGYDVRPEVAEQVAVARRQVARPRHRGGGRGRLRARADRGGARPAAAGAHRRDQGLRRRHHHRARPRAAPRPRLVTAEAVEGMKPGSVIVDLAGETGGNCELTEPGRGRRQHDVTIVAPLNLPADHARARLASSTRATSQSLLELIAGEDGALALDFDDEIIAGACVVARRRDRPRGRPQGRRGGDGLAMLVTNLAILVLAGFVGYAVISKVPNTLHTPLMSGTNAIHGIVVLGGILVLGLGGRRRLQQAPARHRDRLRDDQRRRRLPGHRPDARDVQGQAKPRPSRSRTRRTARERSTPPSSSDSTSSRVLYIVAFSLFIYGLSGLTGPRTAVRGNRIAAVGMAIAVIATLLTTGHGQLGPDRPRRRARHGGRRPRGAPGEDDRDAADGGAVQRRRRRRGGADRLGRSSATSDGFADVPTYVAIFSLLRGDRRLGLLLGLEHRLRQAPGAHPRQPDHARPPQQIRQRRCSGGRGRRAAWRSPPARDAEILIIGAARARRRCSATCVVLPIGGADMPVVISLLNAFTGLSAAATGVALEQHRADRRGHDRRRLGLDAHQPDGRGDEPLDPGHRRRRLRRHGHGAAGAARRRRQRTGPLHQRRRRRHPDGLRPPGRRRPRLRHGGRPGPARRARDGQAAREPRASRSSTPSTPSPAACPGT